MTEAEELVNDCSEDLTSIVDCWKNAEIIAKVFEAQNETLWGDVDAEAFEEEAKNMLKQTRALDRRIRWAEAFKVQVRDSPLANSTQPFGCVRVLISGFTRRKPWSRTCWSHCHWWPT
jgi:lipopolysaccharide biosynthesis glycosyltransferase